MAEEEYNVVSWNAELEVSRNIVGLFRQAEIARQNRDMYHWYDSLDGAYHEGGFKLSEKEETDIVNQMNEIDPHNLAHWDKVSKLHLTIRKYLDKHGFLSMKGADPRGAVYNR